MLCVWCGQDLTYQPGRGWVHRDGNLYTAECRRCRWVGSWPADNLLLCPRCGAAGALRDHHAALPLAR